MSVALSSACVGWCSSWARGCVSTSNQRYSWGLLLACAKPQGTKGAEARQHTHMKTEATTATEKELHACLQKLAKVKVIDTHDHILSAYDRQIAVYATEQFNRQGINLVLNCRVSLLPRPACTQVALQLIQSAVLLLSVGDEPRTPGFRHLSCWHAQATCCSPPLIFQAPNACCT